MKRIFQSLLTNRRRRNCLSVAGLLCGLGLGVVSCSSHPQVRIAFIPQTEGTVLWESAHAGAEAAADRAGVFVYWNAPTREDDVEAQIALVDRVVAGSYEGLVLAPDQTLSLITPVRRALAHGIPTVIIGSPLPIPAGGNLSYILNDDDEGGRLAATRVAGLLKGHGSVALLGIDPDVTGIMIRARAFEEYLAENDPGIRIVEKRMGSFNVAHEQQVAEDTLRANPNLDAIVALMSTTGDGTLSALDADPERRSVKVIAFDSADSAGFPSFAQKTALDCVIQENTRLMGQRAIELIHARLLGQSVPATILLHPKLIDRENVDTAEVREMLSMDFTNGKWRWSLAP